MRKILFSMGMGCCLLAATVAAHGQARKAGLYDVTSQMSMAGMPQMPGGMMAPRTTQVCVTQAMIDKFGGPSPAPQHGTCQVTNVSIKTDGMSATIQCTGAMTGTGTVTATFVDANTTKSTMHMSGTMQMGQNSSPIDMTVNSTSVYKGADCGSVKPITPPSH